MAHHNDGKHIHNIMQSRPCFKHHAAEGVPCYQIPSGTSEQVYVGICNKRALLAGANGPISDTSLRKSAAQLKQSKRPKGRAS